MALGFMCGAEDLLLRGSRLVWGLAERALREWYESGLGPCQRFVQRCHRLRDRYQMTEGRLCQVHLLDDRKLELMVQPKLLSRELLDLVSSHFNLKEKEYFGITYTGDTGQCKWLQLDRRVLDHDFSKRTGPISLKFLVRFYIENFTFLKENITVELFFLNAKASVYNGDIEVESEDVFKLAAYALQEAKGDYTSDENTRSDLKKLPTLPTKVLKEHPSLAYCEDRAIEHYKALKGLTRGQAVIQYLTLVESLPTYGVHYYEVKDKQGIPWWLGISYKGIGQYDLQDRLKPRKLFQWKQLENLYFREKKFAVEVHDPHRRTVTRRTFGQAGLVIHTWYASHSLIKSIWVMAISQHQFYLDRKQSKVKISTARSLGDIAMDLTESGVPRGSKLGINEGKDRLIMASNGSLVSAGSMDSEANEEQKKEKISELRRKERELQGILDKKMEELKKICLREAELTGKLPKEYPLSSGEKTPQVRKRIGTTFKLDDVLNDQDPYLKNLEGRFALQQKIVEAAKKLATETEPCKTVKRKRKKNLLDAMRTLQEIENEINEHRIKMGKKPTQRVSLLIADETLTAELTSLDSLTLEDGEPAGIRRQRSRSVQYSPQLSNGPSSEYQQDRRASANEQHHDVGLDRLTYADVPEPYYSHRDALSTHSSPCKPSSRQPRDSCSMPPTPVMPRNAFSSIQLRSDDGPQPFRHRSGSLESQSQHTSDVDPYQPGFTLAPSRRSNSTEILDDGSSYTSQSSLEYSAPSGGAGSRTRDRWRHRKGNVYASAGSMPNLAQSDSRCYGYMTQACHAPTTYYVTGFPRYVEPEPYTNGSYVYEAETEGHYNVNPSYPGTIYHGHDRYGRYGDDEADGPPQNLYATLRPPRSRPAAPPQALRPELMARNIQRALVEEHLRGWYNRSLGSKQVAHTYERGSQQSLSPQAVPPPFGHANRTMSNSSVSSAVSSRTWRGHQAMGLPDYEVGVAQQQQAYPGPYSSVHGRFSSCRSPECQRRGPFVPDSPSSSASSSSSSSMLSSLPPSSPSSTGHRLDRRNKHAYAKFSPRYEKEHFNPMSGNGFNGIHTDCPLGEDVNFSFAADDVGSFVDINQIEPPVGSHLDSTLDSDAQMLYWHEDSKPGTIV